MQTSVSLLIQTVRFHWLKRRSVDIRIRRDLIENINYEFSKEYNMHFLNLKKKFITK